MREGFFEIRWRSGSSGISSSWWFHDHNGSEWTEIDIFESGGTAVTRTPGLSHQYNMHTHVFKLNGLNGSQIEDRKPHP